MDTYVEDDGPVCTDCLRRVCRLETTQPARCKLCASGAFVMYDLQEQVNEAPDTFSKALKSVPMRTIGELGHHTLVFLTARKYFENERLDVGIFEDLWQSLIQNEHNPGRFGGTNRPGYPQPMKLVAKFASASSARAPLDMMHERTQDQPEDVLTLNMLAAIITCHCLPGDTVIIAMQDPTQFCVGHRDVESFLRELTSIGIPESNLFFYYHGLAIENGTIQKNEAVVSARDLRGAILKRLPRYGVGPGRIDSIPATLSAVLFAMEQGRICDLNTPIPVNRQTSSQRSETVSDCEFEISFLKEKADETRIMDTNVEDDGPVCTVCERRVCRLETTQPARCKLCVSGKTSSSLLMEQGVELVLAWAKALKAVEERTRDREGNQTLVFLTARKSGKDDRLDVGTFDDLWQSLIQNENNPGRFGGTNRPGYPVPMKLMAKCASSSSARAPLKMMNERTKDQPDDILRLSQLEDIIPGSYHKGDTVLIAMNNPTDFCVCQRDVESFIRKMISSGIPESALFFYYDSLAIENGTIQKNEVVVSARDLRGAILEKLPRYGVGPGRIDSIPVTLSAVLFAMEQGLIYDRNITAPPLQQQPPQ